MATKTKKFDCVEMKNRIQAQMMAEFRRRKGEFASFEEFIAAKAQESSWVRRMEKRFARPRQKQNA